MALCHLVSVLVDAFDEDFRQVDRLYLLSIDEEVLGDSVSFWIDVRDASVCELLI